MAPSLRNLIATTDRLWGEGGGGGMLNPKPRNRSGLRVRWVEAES